MPCSKLHRDQAGDEQIGAYRTLIHIKMFVNRILGVGQILSI